jgi:nucleotide-binding universal stress UspA family protein
MKIVMGVHGMNPVERMFFGSTALHVVQRAHCPVLTVRPFFERPKP